MQFSRKYFKCKENNEKDPGLTIGGYELKSYSDLIVIIIFLKLEKTMFKNIKIEGYN